MSSFVSTLQLGRDAPFKFGDGQTHWPSGLSLEKIFSLWQDNGDTPPSNNSLLKTTKPWAHSHGSLRQLIIDVTTPKQFCTTLPGAVASKDSQEFPLGTNQADF
jgi:hypothetical protein